MKTNQVPLCQLVYLLSAHVLTLLIMVWHKLNVCFLYTNAIHCLVSRPLSHLQCDLGSRYAAVFSSMLLTTCFEGTCHSTRNSAKNKDASQKGGNKKHCRQEICLISSPPLRTGFGSQNTRFYHECILLLFSLFLLHENGLQFFRKHYD